jgi:hypothetical protein
MADEADGLRAAGGGTSAALAAKASTFLDNQAVLSDRQAALVQLPAEGSQRQVSRL